MDFLKIYLKALVVQKEIEINFFLYIYDWPIFTKVCHIRLGSHQNEGIFVDCCYDVFILFVTKAKII